MYTTEITDRDVVYYGGVLLDLQKVVVFEEKDEHRGPMYLYTRVYVEVISTFNPGATAYQLSGLTIGTPTLTEGTTPQQTLVAVQEALSRPRQRFLLRRAGVTILDTPAVEFDVFGEPVRWVDARQGPNPVVRSIKDFGEGSITVHFGVEMFLNRSARVVDPAAVEPLILDHRWKMGSDMTSEEYADSRIIDGTVLFNANRLEALRQQDSENGIQPIEMDDIRGAFFHPVSAGFERARVNVTVQPRGNELTYQVIDVMKKLTVLPDKQFNSGLIRVHGWVEYQQKQGSLEEGIVPILEGGADATGRIPTMVTNGPTLSTIAGSMDVLRGIARGFATVAPRPSITAYIICGGDVSATNPRLKQIAIDIALDFLSRASDAGFGAVFRSTVARIRYIIERNEVHLQLQFSLPPITSLIVGPPREIELAMERALEKVRREGFEEDGEYLIQNRVGIGGRLGATTTNDFVAPPNSSGSRGSWLEVLVSQVLQNPNDSRPKPELSRKVVERELNGGIA